MSPGISVLVTSNSANSKFSETRSCGNLGPSVSPFKNSKSSLRSLVFRATVALLTHTITASAVCSGGLVAKSLRLKSDSMTILPATLSSARLRPKCRCSWSGFNRVSDARYVCVILRSERSSGSPAFMDRAYVKVAYGLSMVIRM